MATNYTKTTFIDNGPPAVNASWLNTQGDYLTAIANGTGSVAKANIWDASLAYTANDFVSRLGKLYIAQVGNSNIDPSTDSGSNWQAFKSGSSSGGISYLSNPDFETFSGTQGWNTYNDGGASPTDGTGGTATITIAKNTTNPLFGLADMIMTKPASNVQGQGFSSDFTIDLGATGQPLSLTFSYDVSANYVDNDIGVYLYDKTNANFIPISVKDIPKAGGSITAFVATFFPSTSLSYRLIFHIQSTNATAYTFEIDNISASIQKTLNGAAISNWTATTVTANPTNQTTSAWYSRIGPSAMVRVRTTFNGAPSSFSGFILTLPYILTMDYTMVNVQESSVVGNAKIARAGSSQYNCDVFVSGTNSVTLRLIGVAAGNYGQDTSVTQAIPLTLQSGDVIEASFTIPITSWNSNINLVTDFTEYASNDCSGGLAAGQTYNTGMVYGPGGSRFASIISNVTNSSTFYKVRFNRIVLPTDKIFIEISFDGGATWLDLTAAGAYLIPQVYQVGSVYGMSWSPMAGTTDIVMSFGNYGAMNYNSAYGAVGYAWANLAGLNTHKWRVRKVSNGNMAETPPTVRAEYKMLSFTASVPGNSAYMIQNYDTKVEDTHNAVTTGASWKFTAPISGVYSVMSILNFGSTGAAVTANEYILLEITKNGSAVAMPVIGNHMWATTTTYGTTTLSCSVRLNVGDYISLLASHSGVSAAFTPSSNNIVQIVRIGS